MVNCYHLHNVNLEANSNAKQISLEEFTGMEFTKFSSKAIFIVHSRNLEVTIMKSKSVNKN